MPQQIDLMSGQNPIIVLRYKAEIPNGNAIVLSAALGALQTFYTKFATFLSKEGYDVYTYDYSGIGLSRQAKIRTIKTSTTTWGKEDMRVVVEYVLNTKPEKLILMGQSIGAQLIAYCPLSSSADLIVNIVGSSGSYTLWNGWMRYAAYLNFASLKFINSIFGYFPGKTLGIMEDLPSGVAKEWSTWGLSPNYLFDIVPDAFAKAASLNKPLISYSVADDTSSPQQSVEWLNAQFKNCDLLYRHILPSNYNIKALGHFGFFRSKSQVLWELLLEDIKLKS